MVGNKSDLYKQEQVPDIDASNYAEEIGAKFALTSAKKNKEGFSNYLEELLDDYIESKKQISLDASFEINKDKHKKRKLKCC